MGKCSRHPITGGRGTEKCEFLSSCCLVDRLLGSRCLSICCLKVPPPRPSSPIAKLCICLSTHFLLASLAPSSYSCLILHFLPHLSCFSTACLLFQPPSAVASTPHAPRVARVYCSPAWVSEVVEPHFTPTCPS